MENCWSGCQYCEIILELDLIKGSRMLDVRLSFCVLQNCINSRHSIRSSWESLLHSRSGKAKQSKGKHKNLILNNLVSFASALSDGGISVTSFAEIEKSSNGEYGPDKNET
jgi:hypothetical protein